MVSSIQKLSTIKTNGGIESSGKAVGDFISIMNLTMNIHKNTPQVHCYPSKDTTPSQRDSQAFLHQAHKMEKSQSR